MTGFRLQRLGQVMEPEPGNPLEAEGVLNPAAARGPDGELYLFPRLVAAGNYSRIGIARALFNGAGDPCGVERLGIVLEPEADYERRPDGSGGCEDPRITFVEPLGRYVMTYTALSAAGPRIALAISEDLLHWKRLGLAQFWQDGIDFGGVDDKDASLFPVAVPNPSGRAELAILHRPLFSGTRPEETARHREPREVDLDRESIWISYSPMALEGDGPYRLGQFTSHHRLAAPVAPWERLKIGGGTPPVLTRHGWLVIYHGVSEVGGRQWRTSTVLLGRGDGALEGAPAGGPVPFGGAGAGAGAARGARRDHSQRRVPYRHRPAGRSWPTGALRRLLRDGRRPDRGGTP